MVLALVAVVVPVLWALHRRPAVALVVVLVVRHAGSSRHSCCRMFFIALPLPVAPEARPQRERLGLLPTSLRAMLLLQRLRLVMS